MQERRDRLARVVAAFDARLRLETVRLARIEGEVATLRERETAALLAMSEGALDPRLLAGHLGALTARRITSEGESQSQARTVTDCARRLEATKRLFARADDACRRERATAELMSLLQGRNASAR